MRTHSFKVGQRVSLRIDRLSIGGRGVGRYQNMVVFVPDSAPEDVVEIELTLVKKTFAEGQITRILEVSPFRIQPRCQYVGQCGGCNWQHLKYEEQLVQKRGFVQDALRKFSGFENFSADLVSPVLPSPSQFRYRNRIQLHHAGTQLGYHRRGSHQLIDIDDCMIADEAITSQLPQVRSHLSTCRPGRVELFLTEDGQFQLRSSREADLKGQVGHAPMEASSQFSQVNSGQNRNLVEFSVTTLRSELANRPPRRIYDLYAGNGNFTFPLAQAFPRTGVTSAELNPTNVSIARQKAKGHFPDRDIKIIETDVGTFIEKEDLGLNDIVVLDPPRAGCDARTANRLSSAAPELILYISCHPVTLARDLNSINSKSVYDLALVQPFDMFPQTDHVEVVALLRRR